MTIKFNNHDEVIDQLNAAELWISIFEDGEDQFYLEMENFDDPSHLRVQLDYYRERCLKSMIYNVRLRRAIKWYIDSSKSIEELNDITNDALMGKTSYLVPKRIEEDDELPF